MTDIINHFILGVTFSLRPEMSYRKWLAVLLIGWSFPNLQYAFVFDKITELSNHKLNNISHGVTTITEMTSVGCAVECASTTTRSHFSYGADSQNCTLCTYHYPSEKYTEPANESTVFYRKRGNGTCPAPNDGFWYVHGIDLCFKISSTRISSWEAAESACQEQGMQLIKLDTPEKQAAVMETFRANPELTIPTGFYAFIGASRPKPWWGNTTLPDVYYWLDGTEVVWHNSQYWGANQPNGYGTEECLSVYIQDLEIYDRKATDYSRYICEL